MTFDLRSISYIPTLATRVSEMNGLEQLPGPTKDKLSPLFLLAPWVSSKGLTKSIARIEKAFPNRPYFLDLDRDYFIPNGELTQSQGELRQLFSEVNYYNNWLEFISQYDFVHPCLQHFNQTQADLEIQIKKIRELNKRFCVRIELERGYNNVTEIVSALNKTGLADYIILIEGGWIRDFQLLEAQLLGTISTALNDINAVVPFVVSCTSIPAEFTKIVGRETIPFKNREMIRNLSQATNRQKIIYGDWGSTRPRQPPKIMRMPRPRIDYPTKNSWVFARNREEGWDFDDAAKEIIKSPEWSNGSGLGIWGEQMIEQTANNPTFGVNSPQKNVACRVNIHLHQQAFYDEGDIRSLDLDEDWED